MTPELEALLPALEAGRARAARRRPRRGRAVALAAAAALVVVAVALAATGGWVFGSDRGQTTGKRTVTLGGHTYTVWLAMQPDGRFFAIELYDDAALRHLVASASGGSTLGSPLLPNMPPSGHAMYAASYRTRAGEVWFGDARPGVTRIVLENARSRRFIAAAALPPKRFPSSFRFWVVAVPHTHATTIYAYDAHGRLVEHRALFATREMSLR